MFYRDRIKLLRRIADITDPTHRETFNKVLTSLVAQADVAELYKGVMNKKNDLSAVELNKFKIFRDRLGTVEDSILSNLTEDQHKQATALLKKETVDSAEASTEIENFMKLITAEVPSQNQPASK